VAVTEAGMFAAAIRRKLVREIATNFGHVIPAASSARSGPILDCSAMGQSPGR
jgi:hypothetical protein